MHFEVREIPVQGSRASIRASRDTEGVAGTLYPRLASQSPWIRNLGTQPRETEVEARETRRLSHATVRLSLDPRPLDPAMPDRATLRSAMTPDPALDAEVRALVDDYRERCLWFVRADYYPSTPDEILRVLRWIRARGDRKAFQRAGKIEEWLSRTFNETSAAS